MMMIMKSVQLFQLILVLCFLWITSNGQQADYEASILREFINQSKASSSSLGLADWESSLSPSLKSSDYCNWQGIKCSTDGSITQLDLHSRGLRSPFSTSICNLPNLTSLVLQNNSFSEPFPLGLFNCSQNLQVLDLSYNAFVGDLPSTGWHNLSGLLHLDLGGNAFTGQFPPSIGEELLGLEYLNLWNNGFTGYIPPQLGNLTKLQNFSIAWNNYTPGPLPVELQGLKSVTWFYAASCRLTGGFPSWLSELKNLTYLDLSYNHLSGELPSEAFSWPDLEMAELYFNEFTGFIPPTIGNLSKLQHLDLSCNLLEGPIPAQLAELSNLTLLNLWNNSLTGEIPWELGNLTSLQVFQLFNNSLTGTIPPTLGRGGNLHIFDVSNNMLHGSVPPYLCDGNSLTKLIFFINNISGSIPDAYGSCTTLVRVRLGKNRLSGIVPSGLWGLPNMTILELHDNNLSGEISPEIGNAKNLDVVRLFGNGFSGSLPDSFSQLSLLQVLDIHGNELAGSIPASLAQCSSLQNINLNQNTFTGSLPDDFFTKMIAATSIDLSSNQLIGYIPSSLGQLSNLNLLNLAHNHFSGSIPDSLGNLQYSLETFDVSYNDLSGSLPFQLGGAFTRESFQGNSLCLSERCSSKIGLGQGLWIAGIVSAVIVFVLGVYCVCKRKRAYYKMRQDSSMGQEDWTFTTFEKVNFNEYHILSSLDEDNIIGRGGSGQVYHCRLEDGQCLAVKKLWMNTSKWGHSSQHDYGFKAEIETVGKVRHSNLVRLMCCCTNNRDTSLLVYEYMPNGSLGDLLHGKKSNTLDWNARFKIALGAARGLAYLHHDCVPLIVHRDVKPNNILLDSEYEAHLSDFGLAKVLNNNSEKGFSNSGMAGSVGYMAPEMGYAAKVTEKSDVYSYGVVLLELLTGKKAASEPEFGVGTDIVRWVTRKLYSKDEVVETLLFTKEITKDEEHEMLVVLKLALRCTSAIVSQRPSMNEIVEILSEVWRQSGRPELLRGDSVLARYPSSCSIKHKKLMHSSSDSSVSSSSKSLLSSKRSSVEEPPSPGAIFELEYCKAQLSGR